MGKYLFPLPDSYWDKDYRGASTYSSHGLGKLDFSATVGTKVVSMTSGTVVKAGGDNSNADITSVDVRIPTSYNQGNGGIIRYYHIVPSVSVGDNVSQGQELGTVDETQPKCTGPHLHLDFCYDIDGYNNQDGSGLMSGLTGGNYGSRTNTEWISYWNSLWTQDDKVGRCWEVIATDGDYLTTSSGSSSYDSNVDISKYISYTETEKQNALAVIANENGANPNLGSLEGWARVLRNRICTGYNSNLEKAAATWLGNGQSYNQSDFTYGWSVFQNYTSEQQQLVENVIFGYNYFYLEQLVDDNDGWEDDAYSTYDYLYNCNMRGAYNWMSNLHKICWIYYDSGYSEKNTIGYAADVAKNGNFFSSPYSG